MEINLLDLFSGMGGFHLGLERSGFKVNSYFSEIDKYAIQVYKHNFKESTYVGSVTDVHGRDLPKIDAITFGSPCQDFSLAGKRKGMDGERSSLISEAIRLIRETRPRFFIWENVKGTFSSNNREDFAAILQEFANIGGYRLEWQLLNTKWFLPQNRERIYLVGYTPNGSGGQVFPIGKNAREHKSEIKVYADLNKGGQKGLVYKDDGIMSCLSATDYKQPKQVHVGTWRTHKDGQGFREVKDGNSPTIPARARQDGSGQPVIAYNVPQMVSVRKYEVDIEGLKKLLKESKNKTNKEISKHLNVPKTQVDHWFRSDKSFSIPPKEIWMQLKSLLNIESTEFDESIMTFEVKESVYDQTNRVYDAKGIAPTITSTSGDVRITENRSKDDSDQPVVKLQTNYTYKKVNETIEKNSDSFIKDKPKMMDLHSRIRRLTPIECERLQGFPDDWTKNGVDGLISDTQRYKMCGNAVTVDVVKAVADRIKNVI